MGWLTKVIVAVILQYVSQTSGMPSRFSLEPIDRIYQQSSTMQLQDMNTDTNTLELTPQEDAHLFQLEKHLAELLLLPISDHGLPILYMDDLSDDSNSELSTLDNEDDKQENGYENSYEDFGLRPQKRSRYYRQYPWKRQNLKKTYDAENRYLCQPNKDDVYRLLVALHDARRGSRGRHINFCNRKRPANQIFTHVRFLG